MVIKPSGPHFFDGICIFYVLKISDLPEKPLYLQISFQNSACIPSEAFVSGGIFMLVIICMSLLMDPICFWERAL